MNRWAIAFAISLLLHSGAVIGTGGWLRHAPSFEVTAGEARVAIVFRSKPAPAPSSVPLAPTLPQKTAQPPTVVPDVEGAESSAPRALHNLPPPYPAEAFRRGIQGVTTLLVQVSPQGTAASVIVERSSGAAVLDEAAASAIAKWTFLPARRLGVPVIGWIRIHVRFHIVEMEDHPW